MTNCKEYLTPEKFRNDIKARYARKQASSKKCATNNNRDYTEKEDIFIMADNGLSIMEKAARLGRSYAAVMGRRSRLIAVETGDAVKTWRRGSGHIDLNL